MELPDIPQSWLIMGLMFGLIILRAFSIDSWTTAALSMLTGYLLGIKLEQIRGCTGNTSPLKKSNPITA